MGQKILWAGRRSRKSFLKYYFVSIILFLISVLMLTNIIKVPEFPYSNFIPYITIIIGLIPMIFVEIKRMFVKYYIIEDRVNIIIGILKKIEDSIPFEMIEKTISNQSFFDRILKIGSVTVDTGEQKIILWKIDHPKEVENLIFKLRRSAWNKDTGNRSSPPPLD